MDRVLWRSIDGVDYAEKHCGNCAFGIRGTRRKYVREIDMGCRYRTDIVARLNGYVAVKSSCSKRVNFYPVEIIQKDDSKMRKS